MNEIIKKNRILLGILFLTLLVRFIFVFEISDSDFVQYPPSDTKIYNDFATEIVETGNWVGDTAYFMSPVYPYFLAICYSIFGQSFLVVQILQSFLGVATVFLIFLLGKQLFNKNIGLLSASISSIYSVFIFYNGILLSETLQAFFLTLFLLFLTKKDFLYKEKTTFIAGIVLGITALVRANILLFLILLTGFILYKIFLKSKTTNYKPKQLIIFVLGVILVILPITLRNFLVADDFVPITSNGGINLYIGNNDNSPGVFLTPTVFDFSKDMKGKYYAELKSNKKLKDSEVSSFWTDKAIQFWVHNPGSAIWLTFKKFILFWGPSENAQSTVMDPEYFAKYESKLLELPLINFFFVSFFSLIGILIAIKKKLNLNLIYIFIASYILGTIIFFINGRYRLGLTPLLIVFSGYSISELFEIIKSKELKILKLPITVVVIIFSCYYFLIDRPTFNEYDAYLHRGNIAYEKQDYKAAVEYFNRSLFFKDSYMSYLNLGNAYAIMKDFRSAVAAFTKSINRNPNNPDAHFNLGFAYTQMKNLNLAVKSYQKAIEIDPNFIAAYRNIGIVYYVSEQYELALQYFQKFLSLSKDEENKSKVMMDIENIKSQMQLNKNKEK